MPELAKRECVLYALPPGATQFDLELGYLRRGAEIVKCDAARRLAVDTFQTQLDLAAKVAAQAADRARPWWRFGR